MGIFDKSLSEIRRGTTDAYVTVLQVFHGEDDEIRDLERELHVELSASNYKGEWFFDTPDVRAALERIDRQFVPEQFNQPALEGVE